MIALYVCECGRSLAIASDKLHVPPKRICCDACGKTVELTLTRVIPDEPAQRLGGSMK